MISTEWGEIVKHTHTKAVSIHGRHKESKNRGMYMVEMCLEKGSVCCWTLLVCVCVSCCMSLNPKFVCNVEVEWDSPHLTMLRYSLKAIMLKYERNLGMR
jgi:hypothetical protein